MKVIRNIVFTIFIMIFAGSLLAFRVFAQEGSSEKPILFVREGCPHCANTEEFIKNHGLEDEIQILDIEADEGAAALYEDLFDQANVPIQERGTVPIMFDGAEYFEGTDEIEVHLGEKFDIPVDVQLPPTEAGDENKNLRTVIVILGIGVVVAAVFFIISNKVEK